jgi:hypothetical protein
MNSSVGYPLVKLELSWSSHLSLSSGNQGFNTRAFGRTLHSQTTTGPLLFISYQAVQFYSYPCSQGWQPSDPEKWLKL